MPQISVIKETLPYEINEEIKTLRTNIVLSGSEKKVILITSAVSGEGKSTVAVNLARSFAEMGKKVVVVDGDLRKSHMRDELADSTQVRYGLAHFLAGRVELREVLYRGKEDDVNYIFAGAYPPNPSELLAGPRMKALMQALREYYDYVIMDMSPIGMVIDAAVVAPLCDGTILLIEADAIKYKIAQDCINKMKITGTPILGVVLNKINRRKNGRKYGKYYGGKYYGKYYKKYYGEKK